MTSNARSGGRKWKLVRDEMLMDSAGTVEDPIVVNSAGPDQYVGCTGCPADSHEVIWLSVSLSNLISGCDRS